MGEIYPPNWTKFVQFGVFVARNRVRQQVSDRRSRVGGGHFGSNQQGKRGFPKVDCPPDAVNDMRNRDYLESVFSST